MAPLTIVTLAFFGILLGCLVYELWRQKSPERKAGYGLWNKSWLRWTAYCLVFVGAAAAYLQYVSWNTYGRSSRFDEKARPVYRLVSQCDLPDSSETTFNRCVNESRRKLGELQSAATNPGERSLWSRLRLYLEYVVECHEDRKQGRSLDEANTCLQQKRRSSESLAQTLK